MKEMTTRTPERMRRSAAHRVRLLEFVNCVLIATDRIFAAEEAKGGPK